MSYFKKNLVLAIIVACYPSLAALAASTNQDNDSLQQQLSSLQQSLETPPVAPKKVAPDVPQAISQAPAAMTVVSPSVERPAVNGAPFLGAATVTDMSSSLTEEVVGDNDLRSQAFSKMLNTTLPLSPSQIRLLRNMYDATQQAAVTYPGVPPRPTASSLAVNLSPGATPPVVRLGAGFVTSLVFVDSSGAPWPIDSYSLGNPTAFNIQWDKKGNILLVQAVTAHRMGNLAVILKGLNTPVMVDLNPGQAAMDVRVDLRIPGFGPEAKPTFDSLPGSESPALLSLLDGVPPPGAKNLKSSACESCAWLVDNKLYLRMPFTVLSPAWVSTMSSADGTHVYEMQPTPLVLASYNGKTIKMRIEGF